MPSKALILTVFAGCASADFGEIQSNGTGTGHEEQGTTVLGGLETFKTTGDRYSVSGATATRLGGAPVTVSAADGTLHATQGAQQFGGDDPRVIGLRFTAADGSQLEVTNVYPANADDPIRYDLKRRASSTAGWEAGTPCGTEPAVALSGHYDRDRDHIWVEGDITFACQSGVAYKCIRWGYVDPGDPTDEMWGVNRACTNLANANYCDTDQSWTREGTSVAFFDEYDVKVPYPPNWDPWVLSPTTWPPPVDEYYVEAAWLAEGPPICLAKARWASMPLDPCGPSLPDPRTTPGAKYCEQLAHEGTLTTNPDIKIINTSKYNDLAFDEWQTAAGDRLTTIMGQHDRGGATDVPPFPGMTYARSNGVLLRVPTTVMQEAGVPFFPVFMYCTSWGGTTHKCVVSTTAPTPAYTVEPGATQEGYLIGIGGPGRQALYLYKSGTDYVTATSAPPGTYTKVGKLPLGYVLANAP